MKIDFEESMRRQAVRPVPGPWRREILRAAREQRAAPRWWREWLWPCPAAWGGLAAAWGVILVLIVTAPEEREAGGRAATAPGQTFAMLQQEAEIIAQLSVSEGSRPAPPPQPAAPQPRSSRREKQ